MIQLSTLMPRAFSCPKKPLTNVQVTSIGSVANKSPHETFPSPIKCAHQQRQIATVEWDQRTGRFSLGGIQRAGKMREANEAKHRRELKGAGVVRTTNGKSAR